jgi:hypothetical protein
MTVSDVMALLEAERDERGMRLWEKLGSSTEGMRSYGFGLTRLRQLRRWPTQASSMPGRRLGSLVRLFASEYTAEYGGLD